MSRRYFLVLLGFSTVGLTGFRLWPDEGIWNPCPDERLPEALKSHDLLADAWDGLDASLVRDVHCHLVGVGENGSGIWVNPNMQSLSHPLQFVQFKFYMNASCHSRGLGVDAGYVDRLLRLHQDFRPGFKMMLLAFDYRHDAQGRALKAESAFHVPNEYAAAVCRAHPDAFEWIASIHPYRADCVEAVEWAVANGARAIKWLPGAMGIDPSSKSCDRFYEAVRRAGLPILTHAGDEHAVDVGDSHRLNNPLLLRQPLEQGVKVIVAHCASIGSSEDLESGGAERANIELFARLMAERRYEGLLFGDVSAVTQVNRDLETIAAIYEHDEWHPRLLNGSDFPLPGVMPLFSLQRYVAAGWLREEQARLLSDIRRYNPLLFDFALKRTLAVKGRRLAGVVFESGRVLG